MTVDFKKLWDNYPLDEKNGGNPPCHTNGKWNHDNQCAIRMGVCFNDAGMSLSSCRGLCCFYKHGRKHFLRAKELALWLESSSRFLRTVDKKKKVNHVSYTGKKGIVFFKRLHTPEDNYRGNHIDLWNKDVLMHGESRYFELSKEVWFWEID
jgi:hypothetical protein